MPTRLIKLLALATALYSTGAIIVLVSNMAGMTPGAASTASSPPSAEYAALPVLPTVVVRPEPEIPVLATITVRPDNDGRTRSEVATEVTLGVIASRASSAMLPSGGFDMPYYSFGRTLHRVSKE